MPVALVTHADCILHEMGMHHPESPERLKAVLDALDASGFGGQLTEHEAPLAGAGEIDAGSVRLDGAKFRVSFAEPAVSVVADA